MFNRSIKLGKKKLTTKINVFELMEYYSYAYLVRKKINRQLGGKLRAFVSGGAALNPDIGNFFLALNIKILQGYGQTEASPLISANRPENIKIETVGPPVRGVEVRLGDDGELLVRGDCVMKGYWRDEKTTTETIIDGWLYTGDIASIADDGFITIIGRKKELIVSSGGDNIAPTRPEGSLIFQDTIFQAMVEGDRRPYLVAIIVPEKGSAAINRDAIKTSYTEGVSLSYQRLSHRKNKKIYCYSRALFYRQWLAYSYNESKAS